MDDLGQAMDKLMDQKQVNSRFSTLMKSVLADSEVQHFLSIQDPPLSQEEITRSSAKLYEFVEQKKKYVAGDKDMIAPGYKPELILNHHFIDVSYVPTAELLKVQDQMAILRRVTTFEMPKDIKNASFENFHLTPERSSAMKQAMDFVEAYEASPKGFHKGLYLSGSFGVGKSFLLGATAHELATHGTETLLVHFPSFVGDMKQAIGNGTLAEKLDAAKKVQVLMLDDLGADTITSWVRDDILGVILQYRMQEQLPLFISSNIALKDLETSYLTTNHKGEQDPLKAKRLMERIRYLTKEIQITGKNRRNS